MNNTIAHEVALITRVSISARNDTRVDTGCIGWYSCLEYSMISKHVLVHTVPEVHVEARDRLACIYIDELDIRVQWNTWLVLTYIRTDVFTIDD